MLNPEDIRSKSFKRKLWGIGYDPNEVNAFLEKIAKEYQKLLDEIEKIYTSLGKCSTTELNKRTRERIEELLRKGTRELKEIETQKEILMEDIRNLQSLRERLYKKCKLIVIVSNHILEKLCKEEFEGNDGRDIHS